MTTIEAEKKETLRCNFIEYKNNVNTVMQRFYESNIKHTDASFTILAVAARVFGFFIKENTFYLCLLVDAFTKDDDDRERLKDMLYNGELYDF